MSFVGLCISERLGDKVYPSSDLDVIGIMIAELLELSISIISFVEFLWWFLCDECLFFF